MGGHGRQGRETLEVVLLCDLFPPPLTEPSKLIFGQSWDFVPTRGGGGLTQSQLFIKIDQNLICLGTVHKCDETHST